MLAETAGQLRAKLRRDMRKRGVSRGEDAHARALRKSGWIIGTAGDFPEDVGRYRDSGVGRFYFQVWETEKRDEIELLAEVLKRM